MAEENTLDKIIDIVSKEKGIERQILVEAIEQAILTAAKKVFGADRELEAQYSDDLGEVELFQYMVVVEDVENPDIELSIDIARKIDPDAREGDELGFQIFYREEDQDKAREEDRKHGDILNVKTARKSFGRIAAQTAKQVIIQKVREAERDLIYREYKDRKGEVVTGIARRFERGNIIIDLGRAEAILPISQQMPRESYRAGDRVQAYVHEIKRDSRGPQIVLSRTDPGFVVKLFEMEVPEIYEGIVRIMGVAREAGERTKIAVTSKDSDVDPVGACVGMKGARVQTVVQELRGEKIDIIPFSEDTARFVCNAIAPADVARVLIDEANNNIELIVPDDQLSLAIGRKGQNVRLASQLLGWKIEIHSESMVQQMKDELKQGLVTVTAIDEGTIEYIFKLGYHSAQSILNAQYIEFTNIPGINEAVVDQMKAVAQRIMDGDFRTPDDDAEDEVPTGAEDEVPTGSDESLEANGDEAGNSLSDDADEGESGTGDKEASGNGIDEQEEQH